MEELEGILAFCNDVRKQLGRQPVAKLRKGVMGNPYACVVGATINYKARRCSAVDSFGVYDDPSDAHPIMSTPWYVGAFLCDFDTGVFPELEGKGWIE